MVKKKSTFGSHARSESDLDGNAMGLTEAFHPIASDGFTTAMPPLRDAEAEADGAGEADFDAADAQFADEGAFESFYAGRPYEPAATGRADESEAAETAEADLPEAVALPLISETTGTRPASKAAPDAPRRGRHARVADDESSKPAVPEYMRKSRRMRRILIVVIVLLALLLAAMGFFGWRMLQESGFTAALQTQSTEQETDAIQSDKTSDASTETAKLTTVPDLVSLLGLTQDEAVEKLQHGAQASDPRKVNEEGNPVKSEVRVALTSEPADSTTGTPTVYLGLDKKGVIVQAGYSVSTALLGYGSLSFADAVRNEDIIQKTLAEAGMSVPADAVELPEDSSAYTTFDTDGKTRTKEYCSFSGSVDMEGVPYTWSAVLSYDYSMANASGNLADTVRTIFVYVNS